MTVKTGGRLLVLAMLVVLAAGLWQQYRHPRRLVGSGQVAVASRTQPGPPVTLYTRVVMVGTVRLEEVELPNGTWLDCGGDCARAAREAGPDFWEAIRRNSGGR